MTHLETVYKLACELRLELQKAMIEGVSSDISSFEKMINRIEDWSLANLADEARLLEAMNEIKDKK